MEETEKVSLIVPTVDLLVEAGCFAVCHSF